MPTTPNRGYFIPTAGVPPREIDLNEGFIKKVDVDVAAALVRLDALETETDALKVRVDAVITDQGASSVLKKPPPEFIPFSVGTAALSPGNTPVKIANRKFTVNGNWLAVFTAGRRLRFAPPENFFYVASAVPASGGKTEVTVEDGSPSADISIFTDVEVGAIQHGMPRLNLDQVPDNFLPPEKLADPPALATELAADKAELEGEIAAVDTLIDSVDANLTAHEAATTGVHGVSGTIETTTGAQTKVNTHNSAGGAHAGLVAGLQATSGKGAANGYAGLDSNGKIPVAQLPGIGLKSVQRGETALNDGSTQVDSAAITAVVTAKSFIITRVRGSASSPPSTPKGYMVTPEFNSTTVLRFKRSDSSGNVIVSWQVVEFY